MRIGVDIMGGDFAPEAAIAGVHLALAKLPADVSLSLFGNGEVLEAAFGQHPELGKRIQLVPTTQVIDMGEHPTKAIPKNPDSSIVVGFQHLRQGQIAAFAGAGNTGAMLVGGMYTVKTIPGVVRPAIASLVPKQTGGMGLIVDVGANADCRPDSLYQFGILGNLYAKHILGIAEPRVGLMNIGEEEEKGNLLAQAANKMLKGNEQFNFIGNLEGRDLFNDKADVIVCDGFTGNVMIKLAESFYELIVHRGIKDEFFDRFNYENYGGSPILGLNKPVVIGHGISNDKAIMNMIVHASELARHDLTEKISEAFN
ncbi:MAG: phosphate acyltransferase PlsX [Sphingobacteriaceae bacterium]|nr:phosphate acyltransferase PlsX [Sphingobacteriaceae bacterium]